MENSKKQIIILETATSDMIAKTSVALRKRGYETVFISIVGGLESELLKRAYNKIISFNLSFLKTSLSSIPKAINLTFRNFNSIIKTLLRIRRLKPYIVIVRTTPNWLYFLAKKYFSCPVVYFPGDIRSNTFKNMQEVISKGIPKFEIYSEKFAFEKSDGIIHKGSEDELDNLNKKILGDVKITCPNIYFLPYCSKDFFAESSLKEKLSYKKNEIHTVYVGHVPNEPYWIEGLKKIINQKIYLHLYSRTNNISKEDEEKRVYEFLKPFLKNKYLIVHEAVSQEKLAKEISKYDYGFYSYCSKNLPGYDNATGNKIASYLEAGIPVISPSYYSAASKIINNYNIGISFDVNDFDNLKKILIKNPAKKFVSSILKTRELFSMENQVSRLEDFFKRVRKYKYS